MAMSGDEDEDMETFLNKQRRAYDAAKTLNSDLNFAYHLQMQEIMTASAAMGASSSTSPPPKNEEHDAVSLRLAEKLVLSDTAETRRSTENLDRRIPEQHMPAESSKGKSVIETCKICFEDTDAARMFSISGCLHRYCLSCMKRHVEAKLQIGRMAKCPDPGCKSEVAIASCSKFLPPKLMEVMGQRVKESTIPVAQRIYCPVPTCSELMSKDAVLTYTKNFFPGAYRSSARKCMECQKFFCMDCKVPWHYKLTCKKFKLRNPNHRGDEQVLESLAKREMWRQCAKCSHMVELRYGCYHITCRCGCEFCYTCGAEWKNKKATCRCPIWDARNKKLTERLRHVRLQRQAPIQAIAQPQQQAQAQAQPEVQARAHAQGQRARAHAQRFFNMFTRAALMSCFIYLLCS